MADTKISGLPASTTPLAGTELVPIVQGGVTKNVSVANLTAGRAVGSAGGTFTDNFVQGTAAKGVNFAANTPVAGMTSQLLNWYEEGTWTATLRGSTAAPTTPVTATARYTRVGRQVTVSFTFANVSTVGASGNLQVTGLPFTAGENAMGVAAVGSAIPSAYPAFQLGSGSTTLNMIQITNGGNIAIPSTTGVYIFATITYSV